MANTQNELYEALESEFKLKESVIGLERHVQMLASENKLLHNNRKKRINVINLLQVSTLNFGFLSNDFFSPKNAKWKGKKKFEMK